MSEQISKETTEKIILDINQIKKLIPHRYPFLLVDRVVDFKIKEKIVAIKNVSANEEFFNGHFPNYPIMPGVLIIEALAQTSALFYLLNQGLTESDKNVFFMAIDACKFRKQVIPGDTLRLEITSLSSKGRIEKVRGEAFLEDKLACEANLTAMIGDK